jgi:uncharacterized protein DUF5818
MAWRIIMLSKVTWDEGGNAGGTMTIMMKASLAVTAITALGAIVPAISSKKLRQSEAPKRLNLVGQIMDSRCAIEGSHDKTMRRNGMKNAKECTLQCAKSGGSYVLFDPETKTVFQLDDQQKPEAFAGQRVRVAGTYDEPAKTMHIESIQAAE